jgi:predicted RNA-binding protein associated with RNAse of E/G family
MRTRRADRSEWERLLEARFQVAYLDTLEFTGHLTVLDLERLRAPLRVEIAGREICVADDGYVWLQHFPEGARYTLTTMVDRDGRLVQWYLDLCRGHGLNAAGIPCWDDLYLDVAVSPTFEAELRETAEIEAALVDGVISPEEHAVAWVEARRLIEAIEHHQLPLLELSREHLRQLA